MFTINFKTRLIYLLLISVEISIITTCLQIKLIYLLLILIKIGIIIAYL